MSEEKKNEVLEQEKELDANELDEVAGGDVCVCVLGGGGVSGGRDEETCACIIGGGGQGYREEHRCVCAFAGGGNTEY